LVNGDAVNKEEGSTSRDLLEAQALLAQGDVTGARRRCEAIVRDHPLHGEAYNLFAIIEYQLGEFEHASLLVEQAVSIEPRNPNFLNSRGIVLQKLGRLDDALASYDAALSIEPQNAQALYNRGIVLHVTNRSEEALASYDKALEARPHYPEALINRGNVLQALKRFDEALVSYNGALAKNPNLAIGFVNRGITLQALNRPEEALASYDRALAIQPSYPDALLRRGIALEALDRAAEALASYERALQIQPGSKSLLAKRGDSLQDLGRIEEAVKTYRSILAMPAVSVEEKMLHDRTAVEALWCQRKLCAWDDLAESNAQADQSLRANAATPNPFVSLCVFEDPEIQFDCARRYWTGRRHGSVRAVANARSKVDRIRVGYFSSDFCDHPTSHLLAGVFEAHDRSRFEIRGYSYGLDDRSAMRTRLTRAFEYFVDVRALSDVELAERIAGDDVHILVDLNGHTKRNRAPVLEFRPAPVCAHYLGYPGTLGSPYVDYLIADSFVIPPGDERFFSEAIVRLPGCYQANDDKREVLDLGQTRRDVGLPDNAFVFCCFNRPYKITPEVFDVWMRILGTTPGSVLWLLGDSERVESNLRCEATRRGVDAQRLIFAPRVPNGEHLARQCHADLFLDTWPVCAHTTASDALWAGLPLLTYSGRTFISRVAGSLLTAIGLPELIAPSSAAYEALAIGLSRDPGALKALRERLARNRGTRSLFNTKRVCRNLEAGFEKMWDISQRGEAPHGFAVEEDPGQGNNVGLL